MKDGMQIVADEERQLPGLVHLPTVENLPSGYCFGVTRYADVILQNAFPDR